MVRNIYHLPGNGIYGGIKVAYQFADLLNRNGAPCVVATPDGKAPQWFPVRAPTVEHKTAIGLVTPNTNILFSHPPDFDDAATWGGRLVNHCQGTDDQMDRILRDPQVTVLTCWPQAMAYTMEVAGRQSTDVGISISDGLYYDGRPKYAGSVAFMPRRGAEIAHAAQAANPGLRFLPVDGADESTVADALMGSEYYLATSVGEQFGLPALEAMASGAVILSVPVRGGLDYLMHGVNCLIAEPGEIGHALAELSQPDKAAFRARLRHAAMRTALAYRLARQSFQLAALLKADLAFLMPQIDA